MKNIKNFKMFTEGVDFNAGKKSLKVKITKDSDENKWYHGKKGEEFTVIDNGKEYKVIPVKGEILYIFKSDCEVVSDEMNEKKKMNPGLRAYLDKKAGKKSDKDDDKKDDKKSDKKDDKKCCGKKECDCKDKEKKSGLSAAQKKLPEALQKAILKRQGK